MSENKTTLENTLSSKFDESSIESSIKIYQCIITRISGLSFSETLNALDEFNVTKFRVYTTSKLNEKTIDNYYNNKSNPKKNYVVQICLGLHFPYIISKIIIENAGYALSNSIRDVYYSTALQRAQFYEFDIDFENDIISKLNQNINNKKERIPKFKNYFEIIESKTKKTKERRHE